MSKPKENIVLILRELIDQKNIKHNLIAGKLGITPGYLSRVFNDGKMNTELLEKIMDAAGITYSELIHPELSAGHKKEFIKQVKQDIVKTLSQIERGIK